LIIFNYYISISAELNDSIAKSAKIAAKNANSAIFFKKNESMSRKVEEWKGQRIEKAQGERQKEKTST